MGQISNLVYWIQIISLPGNLDYAVNLGEPTGKQIFGQTVYKYRACPELEDLAYRWSRTLGDKTKTAVIQTAPSRVGSYSCVVSWGPYGPRWVTLCPGAYGTGPL